MELAAWYYASCHNVKSPFLEEATNQECLGQPTNFIWQERREPNPKIPFCLCLPLLLPLLLIQYLIHYPVYWIPFPSLFPLACLGGCLNVCSDSNTAWCSLASTSCTTEICFEWHSEGWTLGSHRCLDTSCKDDSKTNHRFHLLLGLVKKPLLNLKRETSPRLCRRIFLIAHELS